MTVMSLLRATGPSTSSPFRFAAQAFVLRTGTGSNLPSTLTLTPLRQLTTSQVCNGGGGSDRTFSITPTRYSWNQYKDQFHFYFMLGLIPGLIVVFLTNVFIGPAQLAPIPECYEPKPWEYHRHPITRWMARYCFTSHQEDYERNLFYINEEEEKRRMRILAWRVEELMAHRGDYPNYFVKPTIVGKYLRYIKRENEFLADIKGDPDHHFREGPLEK